MNFCSLGTLIATWYGISLALGELDCVTRERATSRRSFVSVSFFSSTGLLCRYSFLESVEHVAPPVIRLSLFNSVLSRDDVNTSSEDEGLLLRLCVRFVGVEAFVELSHRSAEITNRSIFSGNIIEVEYRGLWTLVSSSCEEAIVWNFVDQGSRITEVSTL